MQKKLPRFKGGQMWIMVNEGRSAAVSSCRLGECGAQGIFLLTVQAARRLEMFVKGLSHMAEQIHK